VAAEIIKPKMSDCWPAGCGQYIQTGGTGNTLPVVYTQMNKRIVIKRPTAVDTSKKND